MLKYLDQLPRIEKHLAGLGVHPVWIRRIEDAMETLLWDGNGYSPVGNYHFEGEGKSFPTSGVFYFTRQADGSQFKVYLSACNEICVEGANNKDGVFWAL